MKHRLFIPALLLMMSALLLPATASGCSKPAPKRIVQNYLEAIGRPEVNETLVDKYITEKYRNDLVRNTLIKEIKEAKGNYFDLISPLMSQGDARLVEDNYDFDVTYKETIEEQLALVEVDVKPVPKDIKGKDMALESKTLHPLLKEILQEKNTLQFMFKLKLVDGKWLIDNVIYPLILKQVISERTRATVTIPMPEEEPSDAPSDQESGDAS
jgi:hypothetical protein